MGRINKHTVGEMLGRLRDRRALLQRDVAERLGVKGNTISSWDPRPNG